LRHEVARSIASSALGIALCAAGCGDSRECEAALSEAKAASHSTDLGHLESAIVKVKRACEDRHAADVARWEQQLAPPPSPKPTTTPAIAPTASSVAKDASTFLAWLKDNRAAPQKIDEQPFCQRGLCSADFSPDGDLKFTAYYFVSTPKVARFQTHVFGDVSCSTLGAARLRAWGERPGLVGAAGESCEWREGPLKGLRALIEKNRSPDGKMEPGINVYSDEYLKRDADFAQAVRTDEGR
jgi:hypothetical protein